MVPSRLPFQFKHLRLPVKETSRNLEESIGVEIVFHADNITRSCPIENRKRENLLLADCAT